MRVQRQASGKEVAPVGLAPPVVHSVLASLGARIEAPVRGRFERTLGQDLASVRLHAGPLAAEPARAVGAHVYTVGEDIVFGAR